MRSAVSNVRSPDDVLEIRVAARNRVILSHINFSQLERVRLARGVQSEVRTDATRIGLFELSLAPERGQRDWILEPRAAERDTVGLPVVPVGALADIMARAEGKLA
jgi:hypothetical protein